jgi:hypothetical protein
VIDRKSSTETEVESNGSHYYREKLSVLELRKEFTCKLEVWREPWGIVVDRTDNGRIVAREGE